MDVKNIDVVIIGAGASGLTAAHKLISSHSINSLVILEANDRIGGRILAKSLPTEDGYDTWDMGGQWVGSLQLVVMELFKEFGIEFYSQYTDGRHKMIVNSMEDIRTYSGLIPKLSILELLDWKNMLRKISSMMREISLNDPLQCKNAKIWDQETVYSFLEKTCYFEGTRCLFNIVSKTIFGCETSQMSLFFMLYACAQCGSIELMLDSCEGSAQEFKVKGTMHTLIEKLEAAVGKEKVVCGDPVTYVEQDLETGVLVKTEQGRVYHAKHVICAIPPHLVDRIRFEPPLPHYRQQLSQRMPMGNMIKCLVVYRTPFWRAMDLSGIAVLVGRWFNVVPFDAAFDATSSKGTPALMAVIAGESAIYWSQKTKEERKEAVLNCFVALFGEQARTELVTYDDKDWSEEKFIGGCPGNLMQPGCLVYFEHILRKPFGRVHWAGTETARRWMGYVDGAAEAGQRAADEVAACISSNQLIAPSSVYPPSPAFNDGIVKKSRRLLFFFCVLGIVLGFLYLFRL